MTSVTGRVAACGSFPVEVLMKSAPAAIASRSAADVVVRAELAHFEDHLQVGVAAGLLDLHDLVVHLGVAAGEECAAVDHHVHLVGAHVDDLANLGHLHARGALAGREGRCDRRHSTLEPLTRSTAGRDQIRVDAHRGDGGDARVRGVGPDR